MASETDPNQKDEWLALGKAAELLGVHTMTLRRWSDSGRFPSYRTAGGHRRFALRDIESFIEQGSASPGLESSDEALEIKPVEISFAETEEAWADTALGQTRQLVSGDDRQQWLSTIDSQELRAQYRQMGHNLMGLLLQYVAADEANVEPDHEGK